MKKMNFGQANSEDEAREYFKDNYRHNPNVQISMIVEEEVNAKEKSLA